MDDATKQDIKRLDEINKVRMDDRVEVWNALAAASMVANSRLVETFGVMRLTITSVQATADGNMSVCWSGDTLDLAEPSRDRVFVGTSVATIEACAGVASPIHVAIRRLAPGPWCVIALCQEQRYMDGSVKFVLHQEEIGLTPEDTKEERTAKIQAATFLGLVRLRKATED